MKWYVASRTKHKELVKSFVSTLKQHGHEFVYDWTKLELAPFHEHNLDHSRIAHEITKAITDVDVFILISDAEGTDMFIELGIAIGKWLQDKKCRIYIVGEHNKRSLMHLHPAIVHADSLTDVLKREGIPSKI